MISLTEYINNLYESNDKSTSGEDRLKELEKWLKNKKYPDYVETLNKMLKDPKARVLLKDGFGSDLGDVSFTFTPMHIAAKELTPTQSEIDIEQSLKHPLTKTQDIKDMFSNEVIVNNMPIVTFNGNYIIDGHHRWSSVSMVNPEGKMLCFNYDADISPVQMLKAMQTVIASVYAKQDKKTKLPKSKAVKGQNIYDSKWTVDKVKKYISETITDDVVKELYNYLPKCKSKDDVVKILTDNVVEFKRNNMPFEYAQKRVVMPQPTKAGNKTDDKTTSKPDDEGSALHKLRHINIDKSIL